MIIEGTIEQVNEKQVKTSRGYKDSYGIRVNGAWYNAWGNAPFDEGDEVTIEYEINGDFKNITKIKLLEEKKFKESNKKLPEVSPPVECELRGQALNAALRLAEINMQHGKEFEAASTNTIIEMARKFEKYLTEDKA